MGAWIEIGTTVIFVNQLRESHPLWVRGLKYQLLMILLKSSKVSHPLWVRGLKFGPGGLKEKFIKSHPLWVRGLKFLSLLKVYRLIHVAPFVGAWIEIQRVAIHAGPAMRRTLCGCVD